MVVSTRLDVTYGILCTVRSTRTVCIFIKNRVKERNNVIWMPEIWDIYLRCYIFN